MYYVYILHGLKTGFCYKGFSDNIDRRLRQHFAGENKFTKKHLPMRLIHVELCNERQEARKLENFLNRDTVVKLLKKL